MGCNLVQFRTADSTAFTGARNAWAQVPEFRGTLGKHFALSLLPGIRDSAPASETVQPEPLLCLQGPGTSTNKRFEIGSWTNDPLDKSMKETEGTWSYIFNDSPEKKIKARCSVSKDIYSKEYSSTPKWGQDAGRSLNFRAKKLTCFANSQTLKHSKI
ncbi:uncharacterized protein LOC110255652 isoform X1 [Sus scrofa]|uniref:uncharacterized protein LOC110255652 isoform X1 n=1 Tax=Sus scrofa TaxID=9823 RepID=UPI0003AEA43F|nr:uncharacterized protein LOC110255652 isoform X1 [Sus scrofa]